jgi:hypothetical protein
MVTEREKRNLKGDLPRAKPLETAETGELNLPAVHYRGFDGVQDGFEALPCRLPGPHTRSLSSST